MSKKEEGTSGYDRLASGFIKGCSNVAGVLIGRAKSTAGGLSLQRRGESDWLAILRIYDVEGHGWRVAFGNGADVFSALMNLNGQVGKGKFSPDKYDKGRLPDWPVEPLDSVLPAAGGQGTLDL